jgi:ElaB/YqjD/DUF883 family membrane-anchored ribosome-binding protein
MSSSEIAQQADASRQQLTRTLHQLRDQLAPQNLVNEAFERVAGPKGSSAVERMESVIRDHPLPIMLIAVGGALWLGTGWRRPPATQAPEPDAEPPAPAEVRAVHDDAPVPGATPPEAGIKENLAAAARSFADGAYQRLRADASAKLDEYAELAAEGIEAAAEHVSSGFQQPLDRAMSGISSVLQKHPLTFSVIVLALGAALGSVRRTPEKAGN